MAISSSGACSEPTCTWLRPRLPRTNTSYSGQSRFTARRRGSTGTSGPVGIAPCPPSAVTSPVCSLLTRRLPRAWRCPWLCSAPAPLLARSSLRCSLARRLRGVGGGRLGDPRVVVAGRAAAGEADGVHRPLAADHPLELLPVERAEPVVAGPGVELELRIGERDAEDLGLRDGHVDEPLPQLVVGVPLRSEEHTSEFQSRQYLVCRL